MKKKVLLTTDNMVSFVFPVFLILKNVQRKKVVDTLFYPEFFIVHES